ncbi:unnamed protein product [Calypogeia fissa]
MTYSMNLGMVSSNGSAAASLHDDSKYVAHNLIMKFSVSMALKAILRLGIPDILATAGGRKPLSALEILLQLPIKSGPPGSSSCSNLRRLLSPLVREGVFSESLNGEKQPVYGLTEISKWFVKDSLLNVTPIADLQLHKVLMRGSWEYLHELILDESTVPFIKAKGLPLWEYCNTRNPEFGEIFETAMVSYSRGYNNSIAEDLQRCGVLDGVKTLVDLGGGRGTFLAEIVAHNPHIQGVNFDLPDVVERAPAINGVHHVAGNVFEAVPSGDAMLLKFIIHEYADKEAIKILENCFKALPKNGKVILAEYVRNKQDSATRAFFIDTLDLIMLSHLKGARERNKEEYQSLLLAAGFPSSIVIWNPSSYDIIVGLKQ